MNCWILLILLFCNGNTGRDNCRPQSCIQPRRNDTCRPVCPVERPVPDRDCDCDCNTNRCEPRFEARPFINYTGNCGCEEERNTDCGCR